jgi:hypothetical protein
MIVTVALRLVIVPVVVAPLIPMVVGTHDLVLIQAAIFRPVLSADQRRCDCGDCESAQSEQCRFQKVRGHIAFLVPGLEFHAMAAPKRRQFPAAGRRCRHEPTRRGGKVPIHPDVS